MMLGGNIRGYSRTITTAIALETSKGEFAFGLALGIILMAVALIVNLFINIMQQR
jgi:tungstate transport system permease protein